MLFSQNIGWISKVYIGLEGFIGFTGGPSFGMACLESRFPMNLTDFPSFSLTFFIRYFLL